MRDYANVKKKKKRSKDNKTIYYYSLQQLQLDPDMQQQELKQRLGLRLLDWIEDECRRILTEKNNKKKTTY
jgi:hypothetical protein